MYALWGVAKRFMIFKYRNRDELSRPVCKFLIPEFLADHKTIITSIENADP